MNSVGEIQMNEKNEDTYESSFRFGSGDMTVGFTLVMNEKDNSTCDYIIDIFGDVGENGLDFTASGTTSRKQLDSLYKNIKKTLKNRNPKDGVEFDEIVFLSAWGEENGIDMLIPFDHHNDRNYMIINMPEYRVNYFLDFLKNTDEYKKILPYPNVKEFMCCNIEDRRKIYEQCKDEFLVRYFGKTYAEIEKLSIKEKSPIFNELVGIIGDDDQYDSLIADYLIDLLSGNHQNVDK